MFVAFLEEKETGEEERKPRNRNETQPSKRVPGQGRRTSVRSERQKVSLPSRGSQSIESQLSPVGARPRVAVFPAPVTLGPTCRGHLHAAPSDPTFSPWVPCPKARSCSGNRSMEDAVVGGAWDRMAWAPPTFLCSFTELCLCSVALSCPTLCNLPHCM